MNCFLYLALYIPHVLLFLLPANIHAHEIGATISTYQINGGMATSFTSTAAMEFNDVWGISASGTRYGRRSADNDTTAGDIELNLNTTQTSNVLIVERSKSIDYLQSGFSLSTEYYPEDSDVFFAFDTYSIKSQDEFHQKPRRIPSKAKTKTI